VYLFGEINNWQRFDQSLKLVREEFGYFSILIDRQRLKEGQKIKLIVQYYNNNELIFIEKIPA